MDGEQEFAHDRADSLELLEAAGVDKMAVEGPDIGVMASGTESRHVQGDTQVAVTSLKTGGAFCSRWSRTSAHVDQDWPWQPTAWRVSVGQDQPLAEELDGTGGGDTGGADEQLEGLSERFIRRNGVEDLAAQVLDLNAEVSDALVPASDQDVGCRRGLLHRMELVLGLGAELVERRDVARAGADGQGQVVGALPGLKGMR